LKNKGDLSEDSLLKSQGEKRREKELTGTEGVKAGSTVMGKRGFTSREADRDAGEEEGGKGMAGPGLRTK